MIVILNLIIFNDLFKTNLHISVTAGTDTGIIRIKYLESNTNDNIFHIVNKKKVSMVPLCIEHCHLCMEDDFKLRVQSL